MTSREAINLIDIIRMGYICDPQECGAENARELCDIFKCDDFHEACVMAIEALEKQIPKKAYRHEEDYYVCPNCDCQITWQWFESYCEHCGQAIYRSDEDDK